jgi:AcrR family transcriptional regulator
VTTRPSQSNSARARDGVIVRRAPFSENPTVGARGQQTQQRILDAALRVFAEEGYHQCSVDRITTRAGCSRVAFYQYFSSKEDVFRHLSGQVARQLRASTEALDPIGPDEAGWQSLRSWVARHGEIYERHQPVYNAFGAAAETDEEVASGAARWGERNVATIRSRLTTMTLPPRQLDPLILLLSSWMTHTLDLSTILRVAAPEAYPKDRLEVALTDVIHRSLFGLAASVNMHAPAATPPPRLDFGPALRELFADARTQPTEPSNGRRALAALLASSRDVFINRGYHGTRVDDLVEAAGVSHGAFYRYFPNKEALVRALTATAIQSVSRTFLELPQLEGPDHSGDRAALRRWLRRYNASQSEETGMIRVWVEGSLRDATLTAERAALFDWGRRRVARFLAPRNFGDVDTEALLMVSLLSAFGAESRPAATVDAAAHIIERGLLGR